MKADLSTFSVLELLRVCPWGGLLLQDDHFLWMNPVLERWTGYKSDALKAADTRTDGRLSDLVCDAKLITLRSGQADELQLVCHPGDLTGSDGRRLQVRFFSDVTSEVRVKAERDRLARKASELELTDSLTGLANRRALGNALSAQVTRSRRYQNQLSLGLVRIQLPGDELPLPDSIVLGVSRFLRERLRWADVIGRWDDDTFMLILPETGREAAATLLQAILEDAGGIEIPAPHAGLKPQLRTGMEQWSKGMDVARLVTEASRGLSPEVAAG